MAALNVRLNDEDESKLAQLMAVMRSDRSSLIRKLINDQWAALQTGKSFVERRGGHPANLLHGSGDSSQRTSRKQKFAQNIANKQKRRGQSN